MSAFVREVSELVGVPAEQVERLAGGDLSEILLVKRDDGHVQVAKRSLSSGAEAGMLRALAAFGVPTPRVEGEYEQLLLLEHVENDGLFTPRAWADIGAGIRRMHDRTTAAYGWPVDHSLASVQLDNRQHDDWPSFWGEQRLVATAALLDRPWRDRVDRLTAALGDRLGHSPPCALLHGDLWTGNILVREGRLAALIDPACYHGDPEVDLAMLCLFARPPDSFWDVYGKLEPGWEERQPIYQLFPALVHLRLFGAHYAVMVDRLLAAEGY